jgi:dTDP-4-amino-4,6-dideoxygalactose transaminase
MSSRRIRFRDLSVSDKTVRRELLDAVERVLDHGQLLLGPEVEAFEGAVAEDCGRRYCVGVGSGSDALYLSLKACGISPGDEVITTPLSWIATLNAIHLTGASPVFADVSGNLNIDPGEIEKAIGPKTRAIVPVHFNGRMCDMAAISDIARDHELLVIEDAAQAYGAAISGRSAGAFGVAGAFSFNPMKVLPGFGEAGAVVTDREDIRDRLLALRYLGTEKAEICRWPSLNSKMDPLQAAMLMVSRRHFRRHIARRKEIAILYTRLLEGVVEFPEKSAGEPVEGESVFFDFSIIAERRDALRAYLNAQGIETKIKHYPLMPDQPAYAHLTRPRLPVADWLAVRIVCLPMHEKLSDDDVTYVAKCVRGFYGE